MAELDAYVFETLMRDLVGHDRQPSAYLVWLQLAYLSQQRRDDSVQISLSQIARRTGLCKTSVQNALKVLERRRLVRAARATATSVPVYTVMRPWRREIP